MDKLWCVHIEGPDDVIPAPSQELAEKASDSINAFFDGETKKGLAVFVKAVAREWPYDSKSHEVGLPEFYDEFPGLRGGGDDR